MVNVFALELTRIPNVSLAVTSRLAKCLVADSLESNELVAVRRDELCEEIERSDRALTTRGGGTPSSQRASEASFDLAVDGLWMLLQRRLEDPAAYIHPGLGMLSDARATAVGLELARVDAARGRELAARLFGSRRVARIVKPSYAAQIESMAGLMRLIDEQGLRADLEDLVGRRLLDTLDACQAQYEQMVDARQRRDHVRQELRWAIVAYVNAVLGLVRRDAPETTDAVLAHLRPVLTLREVLARGGGEAEASAALEREFLAVTVGADAAE